MRKTKTTGTLSLLIAVTIVISAAPFLFGQEKEYTETIVAENGEQIQLKMVLIPGGKFKMGSPESEAERRDNEGPQVEVIQLGCVSQY